MTPIDMAKAAKDAFFAGTRVSLTFPHCFQPPTNFPRGEMMCSVASGYTMSFEPDEILAFLVDHGVVPESEGVLTPPPSS